jgi:uncharacterized RDD family membrane protein YckC
MKSKQKNRGWPDDFNLAASQVCPRGARANLGRAVTTRPSRTKPDGLKHAVPSLAESKYIWEFSTQINMTFFISLGKRLDSFVFDHLLFAFVSFTFFVPLIGISDGTSKFLQEFWFGVALIGIAISLCKDSIGGQSPCKLHFDLLLIDAKTGKVASPIRCFVRNVFFFFYGLDLILLLLNQGNRKIGDWIAGTRVIHIDPYSHIVPETSKRRIAIAFIISYGFVLLISLALRSLFDSTR